MGFELRNNHLFSISEVWQVRKDEDGGCLNIKSWEDLSAILGAQPSFFPVFQALPVVNCLSLASLEGWTNPVEWQSSPNAQHLDSGIVCGIAPLPWCWELTFCQMHRHPSFHQPVRTSIDLPRFCWKPTAFNVLKAEVLEGEGFCVFFHGTICYSLCELYCRESAAKGFDGQHTVDNGTAECPSLIPNVITQLHRQGSD